MRKKQAAAKTRVRTRRTPKSDPGVSLATHSDATKAAALKAFAIAGTVKGACEAAGVGRRTWYDWIERDPAFGARVLELTEEVTDELEEEAITRAKAGSDTLLIFLLKSKRPQQYRERQEVTIVSPDVKARLARQLQVIGSRPEWGSDELLAALDEVWS